MNVLLLIASIIIEVGCGVFIGWRLRSLTLPHGTFDIESYDDDGVPMAKVHIKWPITSDISKTKAIVLTREEH